MRNTRNIIAEEKLPLPFVLYPNLYGTFHCFSKSGKISNQWYFCECAKPSIENFLKLSLQSSDKNNSDPLRLAPLNNFAFPDLVAKLSLKKEVTKIIKYKNNLCHRCNMAVAHKNYCHKMYGGSFKQKYGWYINQTFYKYGVRALSMDFLEGSTSIPEDIRQDLVLLKKIHEKRINLWGKSSEFDQELSEEIDKSFPKIRKRVLDFFENITRAEFGFKKIGDRWVSETVLYQIVLRLKPNSTILRHYRPEWLGGLEIDIFVKEESLAIEYQGQQHYFPIKAWGGEKAFADLVKRDVLKKRLCKEHGYRLVCVKYTEALNETHIEKRLS